MIRILMSEMLRMNEADACVYAGCRFPPRTELIVGWGGYGMEFLARRLLGRSFLR